MHEKWSGVTVPQALNGYIKRYMIELISFL